MQINKGKKLYAHTNDISILLVELLIAWKNEAKNGTERVPIALDWNENGTSSNQRVTITKKTSSYWNATIHNSGLHYLEFLDQNRAWVFFRQTLSLFKNAQLTSLF